MPQIVQIGPIVQKHTRTTWNCKNEADLTYLGMLDGSFCMLTNKVDLLSRRKEKQIYRLVKIGEEYDKIIKLLKEGFGATLKAIFAGWETPDRYSHWIETACFCLICKKTERPCFFWRNACRKFQNGSEFNKNVDSFLAKSTQISRKNTQISAKVRKSGFLNYCCGSCMWQIASNRSLLEWKLLFLQTKHASN